MKVLLINPPRQNEIIANNPTIIEEERGFNPPLGLLYVAAYIQRRTSHAISVIDSQVERLSYPSLKEKIRDVSPDIVGMTAMTMTLIDVLNTAKLVKEVDPHIQVVLGGPHAHLFPDETMSHDAVDFLVMGEGERTFAELVGSIGNPDALREVKGLVFRRNGKVIRTEPRHADEDLDELPFPARSLVPYRKYSSILSKGDSVTTIITSRGCPFPCAFCDRPHLGKKFRARSALNVLDELEECVDMGIREFLFYDDTFTLNKQRVVEICRGIIDRNLKIGFDIRTRIDSVDGNLLEWLAKAGCQGVHYGVEAGTERVLGILRKGNVLKRVEDVFSLTKKNGIPVLAYFMIGNPTETEEEIKNTIDLAIHLDPDYVHLTVFSPFPGTELYLKGIRDGLIEKDFWREFALCPTPTFKPPLGTSLFSREELNALLRKGYRKFYLRPSYIWRRIAGLRSLGELEKKASAGLKVLLMK